MALFNPQLLKKSRLQVLTDLQALPDVLQWFEQFNLQPLPKTVWMQCQLALVEGFTNAVRHAHLDLPQSTPIDIEAVLFKTYLEMRISDYGKPFNLEAKLQFVSSEKTDPLEQEGGRGLVWMRQLTDEVRYIRLSNKQNCLLMRKKI